MIMTVIVSNDKTNERDWIELPCSTEELTDFCKKMETLGGTESIVDVESSFYGLEYGGFRGYSIWDLNMVAQEISRLNGREYYLLSSFDDIFLSETPSNSIEIIRRVAQLGMTQFGVFTQLLNSGYGYGEAIKIIEDQSYIVHYNMRTPRQVAQTVLEKEGGLSDMPRSELERWFDYEAYGKAIIDEWGLIQSLNSSIAVEVTDDWRER